MNSSMACGLISTTLRLDDGDRTGPPHGPDGGSDAGAVVTTVQPGPRKRNSLMISWPLETDSSSLRMVPTPVPSLMVAFVGLDRLTENVSSSSGVVSPLTATV